MANTIKITPASDGQLRVRIESPGERDLSALTTDAELLDLIDAAEAARPAADAEQ